MRVVGGGISANEALITSVAGPIHADTTTFAFTGTERLFPVPAGVTSLHVVAIGARGGGTAAGPGGQGALVTADLPSLTI